MKRLSTVVFATLAACSSGNDVLTYEEFKAQAYVEPDSGFFIINGDELVESESLLVDKYNDYLQSVADALDRAQGLSTTQQPSIVNVVGGRDDVWSASQALNLTYCIDSKGFGSRYAAVVAAMDQATGAWEAAGRINFVHDASQDNKCSSRNNAVVFNVRQVTTTQFLARAFFPSTSRRGREIQISTSSFGNIAPWTLAGVLRHELGHTIGLRHEHTRPESGTCFEDNNWRALTAYDADSVMHYPQCNGTNTGDLVLTAQDRQGASSLYP